MVQFKNTKTRALATGQLNDLIFYTDKHFLYLHFCFSKHCSKSNFKIILTHFKNSKVAHAHMGHLRGPIFLMQVHITSVYNFVVLHFALNPLQSIKNLCNLSLWCTVPLVQFWRQFLQKLCDFSSVFCKNPQDTCSNQFVIKIEGFQCSNSPFFHFFRT